MLVPEAWGRVFDSTYLLIILIIGTTVFFSFLFSLLGGEILPAIKSVFFCASP